MKKIFDTKENMRIAGTKVLEYDAVDAVQFRLEQMGWNQSKLVPLLGSVSRASEFLSRTRPLSVQQMRNLYFGLGIPAHVLLQYPKDTEE